MESKRVEGSAPQLYPRSAWDVCAEEVQERLNRDAAQKSRIREFYGPSAERYNKEHELGRRVVEILAQHAKGYADLWSDCLVDTEQEKTRKMGYFVQVQDAARALGLLDEKEARP